MTVNICTHNILRRSCSVCDLEQEHAELRSLFEKMVRNLESPAKDWAYEEYERITGYRRSEIEKEEEEDRCP